MKMQKRKHRSLINGSGGGENGCDDEFELDEKLSTGDTYSNETTNSLESPRKRLNSGSGQQQEFKEQKSPLDTQSDSTTVVVVVNDSELSPTTQTSSFTNDDQSSVFKSPTNQNDLTNNNNIRRKSNRISSLKRLNQNQNSPQTLVSSSSEENSSGQNNVSDISSCSSTDKPNQTSDISSTINATTSNNNQNNKNIPTQQTNSSTNSGGKSLRKIQAWTEDDIRWFFEALCEHGKDFPHIQSYIASRCEKKGIPTESIKNYEQVRHFYYRMWHKISQILKISPEVEKGIQEVYGLINYGEIWKKIGSKLECKLSIYLQQLVDYGYTVIKIKGKNVRIRTPVCNALKKIHNISNKINKPVTQPMPKEIIVELIPATNSDWLYVHSLAQNPRLRTKLTMQQRISTLISYLELRWNIRRVHQNQFRSLMGTDLDNTDNADAQPSETLSKPNTYHIRLKPQNSAKLCDKVTLKSTANSISYHNYRSTTHGTTQIDLSLSAYMKNMFNDGINLKKSKIRKSNNKKVTPQNDQTTGDSGRKDSISEDPIKEDTAKECSNENDEPHHIDLFRLIDSMNEELEDNQKSPDVSPKTKALKPEISNEQSISTTADDRNEEEQSFKLPEPPAHQTLAQWLAGDLADEVDDEDNKQMMNEDDVDNDEAQDETGNKNLEDKNNSIQSNKSDSNKSKKRRASADTSGETVDMLTAEKARQGWNLKEGEAVTIGELFLLFCQPNKIVLEYSWIADIVPDNVSSEEEINSDVATTTNQPEESTDSKQNDTEPVDSSDKPMSLLQKFLVAANFTLMNYKKSPTTTNNNQSTSPNNSSVVPTTPNKSRKRAPKANTNNNITTGNSKLLSNLIQETILNDLQDEEKVCDQNRSTTESKTNTNTNGKCTNNNNQSMTASTSKVNNNKNRTTLDDPTKVEEVLKELKIRGRSSQRRPFNKFVYNPNKMINLNGNRPTVLLIRASNLNSNEPNSNQIVLTANVQPQTAAISLQASQNNGKDELNSFTNTNSVLIPIQLETKPAMSVTTTLNNNNNNHNITRFISSEQTISLSKEETIIRPTEFINSATTSSNISPTITTQEHITTSANSGEHSSHWLHDANDISLGSLFCDNANMEDLTHKNTISETSILPPLTTEMETHINSCANDNSVDLMAKFADLAEHITGNDAKPLIQE